MAVSQWMLFLKRVMSPPFDPYHKWLGIPPEEQPPHHYRLLGIKPFETDPDVVEIAADQRMRHLRSFQAGKNGALSQKLLNEIAAAKVCLLDPGQRAEYDAQLRKKLTPPKAAAKPIARAIPLAESSPPPAALSVFPVDDAVAIRTFCRDFGGRDENDVAGRDWRGGRAAARGCRRGRGVVGLNWQGEKPPSGRGHDCPTSTEPKSQSPVNLPPVGESPPPPMPKVDPTVDKPAAPQPESPRPSPDPVPLPMGETPPPVPSPGRRRQSQNQRACRPSRRRRASRPSSCR